MAHVIHGTKGVFRVGVRLHILRTCHEFKLQRKQIIHRVNRVVGGQHGHRHIKFLRRLDRWFLCWLDHRFCHRFHRRLDGRCLFATFFLIFQFNGSFIAGCKVDDIMKCFCFIGL